MDRMFVLKAYTLAILLTVDEMSLLSGPAMSTLVTPTRRNLCDVDTNHHS
jgi:hypothetical protein